MNKKKKIPSFKSEDEEREFWDTHDATDYFEFRKPVGLLFPNLKPSTKTISIRMTVSLLDEIRREASKRDVPYQSFIKQSLYDHLRERRPVRSARA